MIIFAIMSYLYTYSNQALDEGSKETATSNGSNGSAISNGHSSQPTSDELQDTKL